MTQGRVAVGLIQTSVFESPSLSMKKTVEAVEEAIARGAKIICLQELYRTRYFPQCEDENVSHLSETIPGESTKAFSRIASENNVVIIVPIFEKGRDGGCYNTAAVIDADGRIRGCYRKIHIPHDPLFYEKSYFRAGAEYKVFDTHYARIAVLICYDQWFPEAARIAALMGADIIFYPTAIGWIAGEEPLEGDWHDAWETVQRGHAIANGVHVAAANRVGREGDLIFWGGSFACDSFGNVIAKAGDKDEEVLVAELDLGMNARVREGWGFFTNRRPETYGLLFKSPAGQVCIKETPSICLDDTPACLGYHMPAEWERHDAVWLSWPYDLDSFPEIDKVEGSYVSIIKAVHESEFVNLLTRDELMQTRVADLLKGAGVNLRHLKFHLADYADVWFRDYGPTFVANRHEKRLAMVNWVFNAWGEKYPELMEDSRIPCVINDDLRLECFSPGMVLEGGSIDVNGQGTVITTEQCLLNRNRNPGLRREEIEAYLREYLGESNIIWLKQGISGDDTDGHVDDIARFVSPRTVLCAYEDEEDDENYEALKENYEILSSAGDQDGNPLVVTKLPMPGRIGGSRRLPASYANFYIGNDVVLVPTFCSSNDKVALNIIQGAFPGRKVIGIDCREMVHGLGTVHCITQQQPAP
jgi:agmatine deiminase